MRYCPRCGREVREDYNYCPYCGLQLKTTSEAVYTGRRVKVGPHPILLVVSGILLVASGLVVLMLASNSITPPGFTLILVLIILVGVVFIILGAAGKTIPAYLGEVEYLLKESSKSESPTGAFQSFLIASLHCR